MKMKLQNIARSCPRESSDMWVHWLCGCVLLPLISSGLWLVVIRDADLWLVDILHLMISEQLSEWVTHFVIILTTILMVWLTLVPPENWTNPIMLSSPWIFNITQRIRQQLAYKWTWCARCAPWNLISIVFPF